MIKESKAMKTMIQKCVSRANTNPKQNTNYCAAENSFQSFSIVSLIYKFICRRGKKKCKKRCLAYLFPDSTKGIKTCTWYAVNGQTDPV